MAAIPSRRCGWRSDYSLRCFASAFKRYLEWPQAVPLGAAEVFEPYDSLKIKGVT